MLHTFELSHPHTLVSRQLFLSGLHVVHIFILTYIFISLRLCSMPFFQIYMLYTFYYDICMRFYQDYMTSFSFRSTYHAHFITTSTCISIKTVQRAFLSSLYPACAALGIYAACHNRIPPFISPGNAAVMTIKCITKGAITVLTGRTNPGRLN